MDRVRELITNKIFIGSTCILILILLFNLFLFKLSFILSSIYELFIIIILCLHYIYDDEELFGSWKEQISMAFIAESIIISFQEFSYEKTNWFFFTKNINVNIAPNMLTLIVSILYSLSIYFRYHLNFIDKPKVITINILNILFCSSLLSVLISNDYFYIPIIGETSFTSQSFCIFLLVFSWLGMKSLNIFIFPILALLTLGRIGEVNKAMGIAGLFYLMFAYTSIFLQLSDNKKIKQLYKISFIEFSRDLQFYKNPDENNDQNYELLLNNEQ